MTNKNWPKIGLGKIVIGVVVVLLSFCVSFIFSKLADYNKKRDELSLSISNYDREGSKQGLENLKNIYVSFSGPGLKYFADKFLFKDMYKYEVAVMHVNEDYEKAIDSLKGHEDDYYAAYLRGISKFRILHAAYHSEAAKKSKKIKDEIFGRVLKDVRPDFEVAVRKGPGPFKDFNSVFNYDLTSNPESVKKALEGVKPLPKFVLGFKESKPIAGGKEPGKKSLDKRIENPNAGQNDMKKKG